MDNLPIKDLAPGSIVQLDDGRVGYVGAGRQYVMFEPGRSHKAKEDETFKLIHWPISLALMWMERYGTKNYAFAIGWDYYSKGHAMNDNPFAQYSHTWREWRRGYSEARDAEAKQSPGTLEQLNLIEVEQTTRQLELDL